MTSGQASWRLAAPWRCWLMIAAHLLLGGLVLGQCSAWAGEFDEYAVKAAYLYNFAKFVEWPPGTFATTDAPLLICIAGDNPFGAALATLSDKTVENHPVRLRHMPTAGSLAQCHIVFISRTEQGRFRAMLEKLDDLPILSVSDIADFTRAGGMIDLVEVEQRIRFNINLSAARRARLRLSSQLLKLATIVE